MVLPYFRGKGCPCEPVVGFYDQVIEAAVIKMIGDIEIEGRVSPLPVTEEAPVKPYRTPQQYALKTEPGENGVGFPSVKAEPPVKPNGALVHGVRAGRSIEGGGDGDRYPAGIRSGDRG
jgi:hypothetical protein